LLRKVKLKVARWEATFREKNAVQQKALKNGNHGSNHHHLKLVGGFNPSEK